MSSIPAVSHIQYVCFVPLLLQFGNFLCVRHDYSEQMSS